MIKFKIYSHDWIKKNTANGVTTSMVDQDSVKVIKEIKINPSYIVSIEKAENFDREFYKVKLVNYYYGEILTDKEGYEAVDLAIFSVLGRD